MYKSCPEHAVRNKAIALAVLRGGSQTKIAKEYGLSKARVSQITWRAAYHALPGFVGAILLDYDDSRSIKRLDKARQQLIRLLEEQQ